MMPSSVGGVNLPTDSTPVAIAAELYAAMGFQVLRLHGIANGHCTCGAQSCEPRSWGKHPVEKAWQKQATSDVDAVRDLFRGHRGNIGILLGTNYVVVDVDGPEGVESLEALSSDIGGLPTTLTARTGSGGQHLIFQYARHQDPEQVTNRRFAPGLDVKTRNGQFVAAPSIHRSGDRYRWTITAHPAALPDALFERLRKPIPMGTVSQLFSSDPTSILKRARAYMGRIDAAVSGAGGHAQTFSAARALIGLVRNGLSESDAWALLDEYNARCRPPWSESELRHKFTEAQKATTIPSIEDRPMSGRQAQPRIDRDSQTVCNDSDADGDNSGGGDSGGGPPSAVEDWRTNFLYKPGKSNALEDVHENVAVILQYCPDWVGRVRRNEHANVVTVTDPPWHPSNAHPKSKGTNPWTDSDSSRMVTWIHREHHLKLSNSDVDRAIEIVGDTNPYHPVRDYFRSLQWDRVQRIPDFAETYLGATPSQFNSFVFQWWFTAVCARTFTPGCKCDTVLILEGAQGIKKSSALRALASEQWFSDTPLDLESKDAMVSMNGKLIIELPELESLRKSDSGRQKSFFSSPIDTYRPPYGRRDIVVPRQCVFVGTVNHHTYLSDSTGNRRYWPVACRAIDLEGIVRDRDQLWAEAVSLFEDGRTWWPDTAVEIQACEDAQNPRAEGDAWEPLIEAHLAVAGPDYEPTVGDILRNAIGLEPGKWARADQMRVARSLQSLGYARFLASGPKRCWKYRRAA